tara:strand:+ start:26231 stop:27190 length:960 start_codon:yes stop_codon:yes gene_type:complete
MKPENAAYHNLIGNGKPLGFVLLAVQIAAGADNVQSLVSWGISRTKPPMPLPPLPHVSEWLKIYRNHLPFINAIGIAHGFPAELTFTDIQASLRLQAKATPEEIEAEVKEMTHEEKKQFVQLFQGIPFPPDDRTLKALLDQLDDEAEPETDDSPNLFDELIASATGQFYIRVWLPCWILHRTYPQLLLRQARLGDHDALDKLLRLDKSIVRDPGIAALWHEIMHNGTRSEKSRFSNAMAGSPKAELTPKSVRLGLAGLISQLSIQAHCKVTSPEITDLFDAISKVRSARIDTALSPSPDAMKKAVQRNRNWPSIPDHVD